MMSEPEENSEPLLESKLYDSPAIPMTAIPASEPRNTSISPSSAIIGAENVQYEAYDESGRESFSQGKDAWTIEVEKPKDSEHLQFHFRAKKQLRTLLRRGFVRFLMTLTLTFSLIFTIWFFAREGPITDNGKTWFISINTGLSIALGLSIAHGFKEMAVDLRWWLISCRQRPLSEMDLILRSDSLSVVCELLWKSFRRKRGWKLVVGCALWLTLNLATQIAVAMIGLNYAPETDQETALLKPGIVTVPDMSQIFPIGGGFQHQNSISSQQYTANSYGTMVLMHVIDPTDSTDSIPAINEFWNNSKLIFQAPEEFVNWTFIFLDSGPSGFGPTSVYTNRSISSTSNCISYPVAHGGDGSTQNLTVLRDGSGDEFAIQVPTSAGINQTTFFTDPEVSCGPGCSIIEAFEASEPQSFYYNCTSTVGNVVNATLPEHDVGVLLRQLASSAIALQGNAAHASTSGSKQFQTYPAESWYGYPLNGDEVSMASNIAQFSIGVVAVSAIIMVNSLTVPGQVPQMGAHLAVTEDGWPFIWLICGLLVGAQLLGLILTAYWANRVLVKDESIFSVATLLRSVLEPLGERGNSAEGERICEFLSSGGKEMEVIYRAAPMDDGEEGTFHAELTSQKRVRAFEEGKYD